MRLQGDSKETLNAHIPLLKKKEGRSWRDQIEKEIENWWKVLEARAMNYSGMIEEAHKLAEITVSLIEKSGFREYYNPLTGEGYVAKNFTWEVWCSI